MKTPALLITHGVRHPFIATHWSFFNLPHLWMVFTACIRFYSKSGSRIQILTITMHISLGILRKYINENFSILVEGRVEDAREKYPEMEDEHFEQIVAGQPAGSNNKYLIWSCKQVDDLMENDPDPQAITLVIQAVRLFDGNKQRLEKKDINQYKNAEEIESAVQKLGGPSKNKQAQQARADTDVIYQDEQFLVLRPHTAEASCKYGTGTKWCIAATAGQNYFHSYSTSNNKFYFVIDKKAEPHSPSSKFAFAMIDTATTSGSPIQVYDATDKQVGTAPVKKHLGDKWDIIWEKIQSHLKDNPITREVEDARKDVEVHVSALLKGEKVSFEGLKKIANSAVLKSETVRALIKAMKDMPNDNVGTNFRLEICSRLSNRAADLPPEAAVELIEYIPQTKPANGSYWSGNYYIEDIIKNVRFTNDQFKRLLQTTDPKTIILILKNPNIPNELIDSVASRLDDIKSREVENWTYKALMKKGTITPQQMQKAVKDTYVRGDMYHYKELTDNLSPELLRLIPITSGEELKKFLTFQNVTPELATEMLSQKWNHLRKYDLYEILKNIKLPVESIEQFWDGKDPHIRISLLQNPSIGPDIAKQFALSKNSAYRFAVAHNTVTPAEDLTLLSTDESASTRAAVAANPQTPSDTLTNLASDEADIVRDNIAGNINTPIEVLKNLKKDGSESVRKTVRATLKKLETTTEAIRFMLGMRGILLRETIKDDSVTPDVAEMNWRQLPANSINPQEFIAIFLLQNNGHATRTEIEHAWQSWRGISGTDELWRANKYSSDIHRGINANGKGWYWAPPGNNNAKNVFRLTPSGASVAVATLERLNTQSRINHDLRPTSATRNDLIRHNSVTSATAKPGKTYYTPTSRVGLDISGYENGKLTTIRVAANRAGNPLMDDGKPAKTGRSWHRHEVTIFKFVPNDKGETRYITSLTKVNIPNNAAVEFIKTFFGETSTTQYGGALNKAVVRYDGKTVLTEFPLLWSLNQDDIPEDANKYEPMPIKKSGITKAPAPQKTATSSANTGNAGAAPKGPKTTYKIYGKFKGAPAATRLKGKAYIAPDDTQFRGGEQAVISPEDGKLRVKKTDSDHSQLWEPTDG